MKASGCYWRAFSHVIADHYRRERKEGKHRKGDNEFSREQVPHLFDLAKPLRVAI
jgi:hypothetical protein